MSLSFTFRYCRGRGGGEGGREGGGEEREGGGREKGEGGREGGREGEGGKEGRREGGKREGGKRKNTRLQTGSDYRCNHMHVTHRKQHTTLLPPKEIVCVFPQTLRPVSSTTTTKHGRGSSMAYVWQKDPPSPPNILDILVKTTSGVFRQDLHHTGPELFSSQWYPEYGEGDLVSFAPISTSSLSNTPTHRLYAYVEAVPDPQSPESHRCCVCACVCACVRACVREKFRNF